jgi:hypothetical protein
MEFGKKVGLATLAIASLLAGYNAWVTVPVSTALSEESGVSMVAYRRWLISPSQIVMDLRSVEGTASMLDVNRSLFKAAEALKERQYSNVVLAYRGSSRFLVDGEHFNTVGREWGIQNPIYVLRTFTEHVKHPDGTDAFGTWTVGWLGVLNKQLEDQAEFHRQWYMEEAISRPAG